MTVSDNSPGPRSTIPELLKWRALETPEANAFMLRDDLGRWQPLAWSIFQQRVRDLALGLRASGLHPGDRLGVAAPVSLEWELLHLAALSAGVVVVGLDPHDLPSRVAGLVEQADVTAMATTTPDLFDALAPERRARLRLQLGLNVAADSSGLTPLLALELCGRTTGSSTHSADDATVAGDALATIIFTSGTTGVPKGVAYTHAQLALAVDAIAAAFPFVGPGSRLLCWLPLSNLFQRVVNLAAMQRGATTYLLGDPRQIMATLPEVEPDVLVAVPRFYEKLLAGICASVDSQPGWRRWLVELAWCIGRRHAGNRCAGRPNSRWLVGCHLLLDSLVLTRIRVVLGRRIRALISGSAPLSREVSGALAGLGWQILEAYGMSENIVPMAMNRLDDHRLGSVGRPVPGNELAFTDDGRILVRGRGVFSGYLGEPPGARLDADGFYTTSDLGRLDADGYLWLEGRIGDTIKTSTGHRVSLSGVESRFATVSGIDQVMVVGRGRKCLAMVCTVTPGATEGAGAARLEAALRARMRDLPPHEQPRAVVLRRQPFTIACGELTSNMKLRRDATEATCADLIEAAYAALDRQQPDGHILPTIWA